MIVIFGETRLYPFALRRRPNCCLNLSNRYAVSRRPPCQKKRLQLEPFVFGTRGRTDSEHLDDAPWGCTPPSRRSGAQIAVSICRTGMPFLANLYTKKNDSSWSRLYLVPEAGLTRSILTMLLGVAPRRRAAPAPKLLSQFVELECRFSPTSIPKKTTPVGAVYIWYQRPDSNRHAFKGGGF